MRILIAALLIITFGEAVHAQNAKLDSLNKLIRIAKTDTARINLVIKKIRILSSINIDSAINLSIATIKKSKSINYKRGEADARIRLSLNNCMKGAFQSATENLVAATAIYQSLKDSAGLCQTYKGYGMMYGMQSRYDSSIHYLEKAIAIAERNRFKYILAPCYGDIAIGYQMKADYKKALFYQQKSLDLSRIDNDTEMQAYTFLNMGLTYINLDDPIRGKQFLLEALRIAKKKNIKNVELYVYSNLADLYTNNGAARQGYEVVMKAARLGREMGDFGIQAASLSKAALYLNDRKKVTAAKSLAKQAILIADSTGQNYIRYQTYSAMGTIVAQQGEYQQAIPFLKTSVSALDKTDYYSVQVGQTYNTLSTCYERTGDLGKALVFYKRSAQIVDSVRNKENTRKTTELSMNYEFDKKQETQRIEQKNKDAITQARQSTLIGIAVLTLILAVVTFSAYRTKQKANSQLQQQKEEIQRTLTKLESTQTQLIQREKLASLGELAAGIAHEIQNPLNFVTNFSEVSSELTEELKEELQADRKPEALELADDLTQNLDKITLHGRRASAIVKGMLEHSRSSTGQSEPTNLNALANEYLRLAYQGMRAKDPTFNAELNTNFEPDLGLIDIIPQEIGRVLLNLYNNAFYAVRERQKQDEPGYQPTVTVTTSTTKGGIEIRVSDNGTGMPQSVQQKIFQPFFTTKPTGEGTGLGLSLSYDIVTKGHGGSLLVRSQPGVGTEFTIQLPAAGVVNE